MAIAVYTDVTTWVHSHALTTDTNKCKLGVKPSIKNSTVFGMGGWERNTPGLRTTNADLSGFWDTPVDAATFAALGVTDRVVTISPTGLEASPAYVFQAGQFDYELFDQIGELTPFSLTMQGSHRNGLARGQVAKARGDVSGAGQLGSSLFMDSITFNRLFAVLHVFTAGTTITAQLQQDSDAGFGTPTVHGSIGPITTVGATLIGPFTPALFENFFRLTVTAITGTFNVGAAIALAP